MTGSDPRPPTTAQCLVSFGSNLGTRESLIAEAARELGRSRIVHRMRTSRLFETPPIGGPGGQEPFLNAVAALETPAAASEVLQILQEIEKKLGRRRERRWDARLIDLDVVLHGRLVGRAEGLVVPHPRYTARQFVLQPARDVAEDFCDPRFGCTLGQLSDHISAGVPSLALVGGSQPIRETICRRLADEHGILTFSSPQAVELTSLRAWVSAFVPPLPVVSSQQASAAVVPRLVARIQTSVAQLGWPAPHQMWPSGWHWPEYRLEVDDMDWAVGELVSALDSMRCPVRPVTDSGDWW